VAGYARRIYSAPKCDVAGLAMEERWKIMACGVEQYRASDKRSVETIMTFDY
jgi:hypothetical protein